MNYNKFSCLCQNTLFAKRIETFWFRDISITWDIRAYCFKYILLYISYICTKIRKEKKLNYSPRFFELLKLLDIHKILYSHTVSIKALVENWSISFFSYSGKHESSTINEVIRSVLNFFILFFYDKISQVQNSTKR